jgi:hypothetical protein
MSFIDNIRSFVTGMTPEDELKQVRGKIAAGTAEIARLDAEISRRAEFAVKGDQAAREVIETLRGEKAEISAHLDLLRQAEARLAAAIAAEQAANRQAEIAAKPLRLARLSGEFLARERKAVALAKDPAAELLACAELAHGLGAELGGGARRAFEPNRWLRRFRSQITHHFAFEARGGIPRAAAPGEESTGGAHTPATNLLNLQSDATGAAYWREPDAADQDLLDDLCALYPTLAEAKAAQQRRAARNAARLPRRGRRASASSPAASRRRRLRRQRSTRWSPAAATPSR